MTSTTRAVKKFHLRIASEEVVQYTTRSGHEDAKPPPSISLLLLGRSLAEHVEWHIRALGLTGGLCAGSGGGERVECCGWKHLRRRHGQVKRHERRTVEFVEVQPGLLRVAVLEHFVALRCWLVAELASRKAAWRTYHEQLGGIVSRVDRVLVCARIRVQLASVALDGRECERAVVKLLEAPVLPLDYTLGTSWVRCCSVC